jgi:hypothetical protein
MGYSMFVVLQGRLTQQSLFQDALGGFVQQVLLGMGNRHQPRFCRMLEVVVAAPDPHQVPAVRDDMTYQISAIHSTSLWCVLVVTITTRIELSTLYPPSFDDWYRDRWLMKCMSAQAAHSREVLPGFSGYSASV